MVYQDMLTEYISRHGGNRIKASSPETQLLFYLSGVDYWIGSLPPSNLSVERVERS